MIANTSTVATLRETLVLWWHESVRGHRVRRQRLDGDEYIPCLQCACGVDIR